MLILTGAILAALSFFRREAVPAPAQPQETVAP
jgi:hypothetical protein